MLVQQHTYPRAVRSITCTPIQRFCLLGVLLLSGGIVEAAEPATTEPADVRTFEVNGKYQAGQQLLLTQAWEMQASRIDADSDAETVLNKIAVTLEMPVSVSKSDTPGELNVQMSVRRMAMRSENGGRVQEIDSDKPETLTGSNVSDLMLVGAHFHAVLDKAGNVKTITPDDEFLNGPHFANRKPDAKEREIQELGALLTFYLENPWAYTPNRDVAVGDSWSVLRTTFTVPFLSIRADAEGPPEMPKEDVECTLDQIEKMTPRGSAAVINIAGKIKFPKSMEVEQDVTVAGTVRVDVSTGELYEHRMDVSTAKGGTTIRLTATTTLSPLPTTQPATAPSKP